MNKAGARVSDKKLKHQTPYAAGNATLLAAPLGAARRGAGLRAARAVVALAVAVALLCPLVAGEPFVAAVAPSISPSAPAADSPAPAPGQVSPEEAASVVVVANKADSESVVLAGYYLEKRGIPFSQLVLLTCPLEEEISREDYERTLATPLREAFLERGWWRAEPVTGRIDQSRIRTVALVRGIPLKIREVSHHPGDQPAPAAVLNHNAAAVDSELAALGLASPQISGIASNPLWKKPAAAVGFAAFQKGLNGGVSPFSEAPWMLMVCRLDAPRAETVRRMIDDAIAAETAGLQGMAYIDERGLADSGLGEGDRWLRNAARALRQAGTLPCVEETTPTLFPENYPMTRAALYLGWYSEQVGGVFKTPGLGGLRFEPGAVAVHIHSFSASTLREPLRQWCGPLLEMGAAATLGNVYEPYLSYTTHLDRLAGGLLAGATFAEAAYAATPGLSWMNTFIGDPLYRPFARRPAAAKLTEKATPAGKASPAGEEEAGAVGTKPAIDAEAIRQGIARGMALEKRGLDLAATLRANDSKAPGAPKNSPSAETNAAQKAAIAAWQQAAAAYPGEPDRLRCMLHAVWLLRDTNPGGKPLAALSLLLEARARHWFRHPESLALLQAIERELAPPPPAAPAVTPAPDTPPAAKTATKPSLKNTSKRD